MTRIKVEVEIVPITCGGCGVHFGLDKIMYDRLQESGDGFYCPNGHNRYFTRKKDMDKRIKELEARLQEAETDNRYLSNDLEQTKRSLSATKGVLTRTKNRIHKGICPVCNRQFVNLHRHMEGQHPRYLEQPQ